MFVEYQNILYFLVIDGVIMGIKIYMEIIINIF